MSAALSVSPRCSSPSLSNARPRSGRDGSSGRRSDWLGVTHLPGCGRVLLSARHGCLGLGLPGREGRSGRAGLRCAGTDDEGAGHDAHEGPDGSQVSVEHGSTVHLHTSFWSPNAPSMYPRAGPSQNTRVGCSASGMRWVPNIVDDEGAQR